MFTFTAATNSVALKDAIVECPATGEASPSTDRTDNQSSTEMGKNLNDNVNSNHRNNSGNQGTNNDDGRCRTSKDDVTPSSDMDKFTNRDGALCCDKHKGSGDRVQCGKCRAERTKSLAGHE